MDRSLGSWVIVSSDILARKRIFKQNDRIKKIYRNALQAGIAHRIGQQKYCCADMSVVNSNS